MNSISVEEFELRERSIEGLVGSVSMASQVRSERSDNNSSSRNPVQSRWVPRGGANLSAVAVNPPQPSFGLIPPIGNADGNVAGESRYQHRGGYSGNRGPHYHVTAPAENWQQRHRGGYNGDGGQLNHSRQHREVHNGIVGQSNFTHSEGGQHRRGHNGLVGQFGHGDSRQHRGHIGNSGLSNQSFNSLEDRRHRGGYHCFRGSVFQPVNHRRNERGKSEIQDGMVTKDSNLPQLVQEIQDKLTKDTVECMICCDAVRRSAPVWSCGSCYSIFHLSCIKKWARAPSSIDMSAGKNQGFNWRCPGCQSVQLTSSKEIRYMCFCTNG